MLISSAGEMYVSWTVNTMTVISIDSVTIHSDVYLQFQWCFVPVPGIGSS